jgi:hypothetical protein
MCKFKKLGVSKLSFIMDCHADSAGCISALAILMSDSVHCLSHSKRQGPVSSIDELCTLFHI